LDEKKMSIPHVCKSASRRGFLIKAGVCGIALGTIGIWLAAAQRGLETPQAILDKAIAAHGGEENLSKWKMGRIKMTYKADIAEGGTDETFYLPDKQRNESL
jgi:hypothetical protein